MQFFGFPVVLTALPKSFRNELVDRAILTGKVYLVEKACVDLLIHTSLIGSITA